MEAGNCGARQRTGRKRDYAPLLTSGTAFAPGSPNDDWMLILRVDKFDQRIEVMEEAMRRTLSILAFLSIFPASAAHADFVGTLEFTPADCETARQCKLAFDFGYVDTKGIGWQANAGDATDGATIPEWAQPLVGSSFDKSFVKAAAIHDHYVVNHVRTWQQTHLMFYDALIDSGVPAHKAQIMYFAVLAGGPRWIELVEGIACPVGMMCISSERMMQDPSVHMMKDQAGAFLVRDESYDSPEFKMKMDAAHQFMAAKGDEVTAGDLAGLADLLEPANAFKSSADMAIMPPPAATK
jgi:Protein of unknown function (DUF1353)